MAIFVDCDWGRRNRETSDQYQVRGYPTVVFTDPDGAEVDRMKSRDAAALAAQIEDVATKYGKK